jgi:hypothetical protein
VGAICERVAIIAEKVPRDKAVAKRAFIDDVLAKAGAAL